MKQRSGYKVMLSLIKLVKPLTLYMILAILMGLIGHLCASFITILGGYAILDVLNFNIGINLSTIFIIILLCALFRGVFRYIEQSCNHYIAFKLLALLRDKVFVALRKLCPAKLEGRDKGNLIAVITSDIELLEVFYAHTISPIVIALLFSTIMIVFIGNYHWLLGIIAFMAYLFIGLIIPLIISKLNGNDGLKFRTKSGNLSSFVLDSLRGLSEILQYNNSQKRLLDMDEYTDELIVEEEKMKINLGRNTAITNSIILIFDFLMLFISALLYQKNIIGFNGVLISTLALFSSFGPVIALANLGSTLQNTFAAGNRVLDILEEEPVVNEVTGNKEIEFLNAEAKDVTFSYDDEIILSNLSLKIPKNSITGIVGCSGSGKSTLLKLFMRFWDVKDGSIKISDEDVSKINTSNLRNMESFVSQETHLFHDSIKNNLLIAKLDASDEEIVEACKKAAIHDFILTLPKGYDTPVGELGDTLSSGQKQRIGLARAFLHNAPFMLLDEPTSNLDSLNEGTILKAINEEKEDRTIVLVSHRQSTMRIVDNVYCVEHGRIS
ncbi:amino acid ABC transporter ATP-binding/permease protein [Thomasclavelia spiroformis]|uniref:amino acid ABC transporter ATP-binding/permease protein n=1 Tax=Thomasclavelia spiroformis TaxID=29348 RepID=UPI000B390868|nr:ABC transporter ATP-binding protein [Thomasclavelia spiroformis]OUQ01270.1 ABC transporter ATP-binding protein [Thomasclavelia spiroformis]